MVSHASLPWPAGLTEQKTAVELSMTAEEIRFCVSVSVIHYRMFFCMINIHNSLLRIYFLSVSALIHTKM